MPGNQCCADMGQVAVHIAGTEAEFAAVRRLCRDYRALLAERTSEWPEIIDTYLSCG